jgi:hypothetical protein
MANIPGQIIGELGELGKKVGGEAAKVPTDIAGKALETLGSSSKTKGGQSGSIPKAPESGHASALDQIAAEKRIDVKRHLARRALEELTRGRQRPKEPSIWERLQMEERQKKEQAVAAEAQADKTKLVIPKSTRPRGDLFGVKAKKTATENRNVRQD